MTKIIIEGDLAEKHIRYISKYLVKEFEGKKEHVDVLIEDSKSTLESVKKNIKEIWE